MLLSLLGALLQFQALAQTQASFQADAWEVKANKHEFLQYKGKPSLYLEGGHADLKGANFKNGIIDFDISFEEGRKFAGVHFRVQDAQNYEEYYLRAHQSGNPDAMQYTPVFNGAAGWQLYYGKGHSTAYSFNFGEWTHVRLIVSGDKMDVFLNDMSQAVLHVHELKMEEKSGGISFWTLLGGAYYANLSYQEMDNPPLVSKTEPLPAPAPGTVTSWQVSGAFAAKGLESIHDLEDFVGYESANWQALPSEFSGVANLARVAATSENTNTVFAKIVINSDKKQVKQLDFGYSDAARVYVNGALLYSGQRRFRSRDYRYLGTIGYFDAMHLHLKKGRNEVVFAVSEAMGGWGIQAKFADMEGITIGK